MLSKFLQNHVYVQLGYGQENHMVWLKIPLLVATNTVKKCPKISPKIPASDADMPVLSWPDLL